MKSPIKGGDGNTEFLFYSVCGSVDGVSEQDIAEAVNGKD